MSDIGIDDEILQIFYEEAKEHLDGIEGDLLLVEEQGENLDDDLINNVFRAIHTIKGGCGFFGLTKVSSLSHAMENLLDRIRKKTIIASSEIVNTLLQGADLLSQMINEPEATDEINIEPITDEIQVHLDGGAMTKKEKLESETIKDIKAKDGHIVFQIEKKELEKGEEKGQVYLLEYDLIKDVERKNKTPWDIISELMQLCTFIDSKVDIEAIGTLSTASNPNMIPFYALVSTVIEPDLMADFVELKEEQVHLIVDESKDKTESQEDSNEIIQTDSEEKKSSKEEKLEVTETIPKPKETIPKIPELVKLEKKEIKTKTDTTDTPKKKNEGSIRVNLGLLDKLMSLAGELVLTRNQLLQGTEDNNLELISSSTQQVDFITAELQEAVMATRMQSIGIVFHKFNRVVRDTAKKLGKKIELELEGADVELDKTIIETIGDPLTHLVRNSLDHGIETPDVRVASGKNETGTLKIGAKHEAGHVVIEIIDDGGGIDPDKVKAKAYSMGIATQEELDKMPDKEAIKLIFKPGFSTAEKVTDISGRGVGMDVVVTNLTKLGGTIELNSEVRKGTTITIKLPLTLAIIPSLIISVAEERFAIPQVNLVELVRLSGDELEKRIESVGEAKVMRLRNALLPLIDMRDVLGVEPNNEEKILNVAVVMAGNIQYGLIVDNLLDSSEIVVKPLGKHLAKCQNYAGATILGDGYVALILDIIGISNSSHLANVDELSNNNDLTKTEELEEQKSINDRDKQSLLIVKNGPEEQFGIPLGLVARIEKIKVSEVEHTGGRNAIKYKGDTLPLFEIEELAHVSKRKESEKIIVVVFKTAGREVGLILSEILDVVETSSHIDDNTYKQSGIMGSVIIENHITLIIDLYNLVYSLMPNWKEEHQKNSNVSIVDNDKERTPTVLIAEDSKFFMSQIEGFMKDAGYDVITAADGALAYNALSENADNIDLVLTDIEMPNMNGFEFVELARKEVRFKNLPMIAITSVAGEEAEKRGEAVGLDEYLVKLDQDQIVETCKHYLENGRN